MRRQTWRVDNFNGTQKKSMIRWARNRGDLGAASPILVESAGCVQDGPDLRLVLQMQTLGQSPEGLLQGGANHGEKERKEAGEVEEDREETDAGREEGLLTPSYALLRQGGNNELEDEESRETGRKADGREEIAEDQAAT